mgnify:CR=1 FL=1
MDTIVAMGTIVSIVKSWLSLYRAYRDARFVAIVFMVSFTILIQEIKSKKETLSKEMEEIINYEKTKEKPFLQRIK